MYRTLLMLTAALGLSFAPGCGSDDKDDDSAAADCDDPDSNPYAGTCVETYLADCWDPSGECEGVIETTTGNSSYTWENGAQMTTEVTISGTSAVVLTTLYNSGGVECAVAETLQGAGGCFSQTTYTRTADGATQTYCTQEDGSLSVTCDDGSTVDVSAAESDAAGACESGGDAQECSTTYAR